MNINIDAATPLVDSQPTMGFAAKPPDTAGLFGAAGYEKGEEFFCSDWGQLEEGHYVIVQRYSEPPIAGEVDVVADDGSVFWVWLEGGRGRIAIYVDEGVRVWLPRGYRL